MSAPSGEIRLLLVEDVPQVAQYVRGYEELLADRDVQATLRRTWANMSPVNKAKLVGGLLGRSALAGARK